MIDTDKYLDIPFSEADCYQLGSILHEDIKGYPLPSLDYEVLDIKSVLSVYNHRDSLFKEVSKEELMVLDGIVFRSESSGRHMGFYLGAGWFIHQVMDKFPTLEKLSSPEWSNRILGYYRYEQKPN